MAFLMAPRINDFVPRLKVNEVEIFFIVIHFFKIIPDIFNSLILSYLFDYY